MLEDKDRTTLVLVLNPSANGGNLTVELPRNVVDSKGPSNADTQISNKDRWKGSRLQRDSKQCECKNIIS